MFTNMSANYNARLQKCSAFSQIPLFMNFSDKLCIVDKINMHPSMVLNERYHKVLPLCESCALDEPVI